MNKLILLAVCMLLYSCSTWQTRTESGLNLIYASAKTLHTAATPIINDRCMAEAKKCADAKDTPCKPLVEC